MASHGVPRIATTPLRTEEERQEELEKIKKYQALVDLIHSKIEERQYTTDVLALTSQLLTKNPEYYTIWNVRRRLLTSLLSSKSSDGQLLSTQLHNTLPTDTTKTSSVNSSSTTTSTEASEGTQPSHSHQNPGNSGITLETIKNDLTFVVPLLKKWPKCYWIWDHRIWLLHQASARLEVAVARQLWQDELLLCSMMLVRDNRNFHGWGYRRLVVEQLESPMLNGKSMVEDEFAYTTKMVHAHLSNFSAWHNRSKLIPRLLNERKAGDLERRRLLDEEFDMMRNALWTDASDQSLWFYHHWLMITLLEPSVSILPNFTTEQRLDYAAAQIDDLKEMLDGAEDPKWIYNALIEYTLAICGLSQRPPNGDERRDTNIWLSELRKLDPKRKGRWDDRQISLEI